MSSIGRIVVLIGVLLTAATPLTSWLLLLSRAFGTAECLTVDAKTQSHISSYTSQQHRCERAKNAQQRGGRRLLLLLNQSRAKDVGTGSTR